ncbi:MAG: T9SS type A sorting domain-containing protein [Ignavibacteria bacterium]|jgi:hypothetical protein
MKKNIIKNLLYILFPLLVIGFVNNNYAKGEKGGGLKKTTGSPAETKLNINRISTYFVNNGDSDYDGSDSGFEYPKGSNDKAFFESGLVWGCVLSDYTGDDSIRVGGSAYRHGLQAGRIEDDGSAEDGNADNVRIYRVRPDYATADLESDAEDIGVSESAVYQQYEDDWFGWPAEDGAPYEDVDGNGSYDPNVDIPGFPGADQTVWFVANDLNADATVYLYGSQPLGIEMQFTAWAYNRTGALGNMIFRKYILINKNSEQRTFKDMYVSQWSDPDLGGSGDDLAGCDTSLSLGFIYNGFATDEQYEDTPPAAGFDFFQGPIVDAPGEEGIFKGAVVQDKKNLPMTTYYFFINSDDIYADPSQGEYLGTIEFYRLLRGYISTTGDPFKDPITGEETKFTLAGDPVAGTGWVDSNPGDRRIGLCSGPFEMAYGDTQEVVVAQIAAGASEGVDRLSALSLLKFYDQEAQALYDNFFEVANPAPAPQVEVTELDQKIILNWGLDVEAYTATETFNEKGYEFQGYNIYQLESESTALEDAKRIATYDIIDGISKIIGPEFDSDGGTVLDKVLQFGNDTGIKRYIEITDDALNSNIPLRNGNPYYFAVTSYTYNSDLDIVPNTIENALDIIEIYPHATDPGVRYYAEVEEGLEVEHTTGTANATVEVKVVDPSLVTGDEYEVYFNQQHYYMDFDGIWKETNYPDSVGKSLNKPGDVSQSTITGISITSPTAGTRDLTFTLDLVSPDYNCAEGVELTFPSYVQINSADGLGAEAIIDEETNSVVFGHKVESEEDMTGGGYFCGGETIIVNINTVDLPLDVDFIVYDDGWATLFCADPDNAETCEAYGIVDAIVVNATGVCTITEEAYAFESQYHWNVRNVSTGEDVLEDQTILEEIDIYAGVGPGGSSSSPILGSNVGENSDQIIDGLQVSIKQGSYDAPIEFNTIEITRASGSTTQLVSNHSANTDGLDISNYTIFSGVATSWAIENFEIGTSEIDILQQDYELKFTGVLDTVVTGTDTLILVSSGGQMGTIFKGLDDNSLPNHPLNPNPGSSDPFLIRIPFEVWNVDDPDNPRQVNLVFRDRMQSSTDNPFYAWNLENRMYAIIVNSDYDGENPTPTDVNDDATWVLVFYSTNYEVGDVVTVSYANPFQVGKDTYGFTAPAATTTDSELAKEDVEKINVFPNPYYGYNSLEINKYQRFVTISHLPDVATIRIFNLAGQLVKTINHNDATSQFDKWDLTNESGLPVASGMYILHIDMPNLGKEKILKVGIIQEQQFLDRF